jgi:hypothetical protein
MNAYSKDLRLKVLSAIDRGIPRKEVSDLFGVSLSTIKRWLKKKTPDRGRTDLQDPRQTICEGQGFEGVAAFSAELQSRPDPHRALSGL